MCYIVGKFINDRSKDEDWGAQIMLTGNLSQKNALVDITVRITFPVNALGNPFLEKTITTNASGVFEAVFQNVEKNDREELYDEIYIEIPERGITFTLRREDIQDQVNVFSNQIPKK